MRWVRSLTGLPFVGFMVLVLAAACRSTVERVPAEAPGDDPVTEGGGTPFQDVRRWDAGVEPREGPPPFPAPAADAGACPGRQERCCDGHCGTALECAQLACDPAPQRQLPAEER
jgi:hypothetical protein